MENGEVPTLSVEYWNLPWLSNLHTSETVKLNNPFSTQTDLRWPFAPNNLRRLATITFANCTEEVFAIMPQLRKLGICETKDDYNSDPSCIHLRNLFRLKCLKELKCSFYKESTKTREIFGPNIFPSNLRKLTLSWSYMPWKSMIHVAMLPNLEVLKLKNYAFQGAEWEPSEEGFRHLKQLLIDNTDLVHWNATSDHFPLLQHLVLRSCKLLEEVPLSVGDIATLQLIELHCCSESAEISAKDIQEQIEGLDIRIRSNP